MGESFSQLEERAKRATTIEELFCLWKRAHAAEVGEGNWEKTCQFKEKDKGKKHPFEPQKRRNVISQKTAAWAMHRKVVCSLSARNPT